MEKYRVTKACIHGFKIMSFAMNLLSQAQKSINTRIKSHRIPHLEEIMDKILKWRKKITKSVRRSNQLKIPGSKINLFSPHTLHIKATLKAV